MRARFDATVLDLLTTLIDSWSLWNSVVGSDPKGFRVAQAGISRSPLVAVPSAPMSDLRRLERLRAVRAVDYRDELL
jgi:hypothetical protein